MGKSYADKAHDAVADGSWKEVAWTNLARKKFVDLIYEEACKADPAFATLFDQVQNAPRQPDTWSTLATQNLSDYGPLLLSQFTPKTYTHKWIGQWIESGSVDLGEPFAPHLEQMEHPKLLVPWLSGSHHKEDRDIAWENLQAELSSLNWERSDQVLEVLNLMNGFVVCQDERVDDAITQAMTSILNSEVARSGRRSRENIVTLAQHMRARSQSAQASNWAVELTKVMHRDLTIMWALGSLATTQDNGVVEALQKFRALRIDDSVQTRAWRVASDYALVKRGEDVSLGDARWIVAYGNPKRYGWPKTKEDLPQLYAFCAELFLHHGTQQEKEWVASWKQSPSKELREMATRARDALGLPAVKYKFISTTAIQSLHDVQGSEALIELLEDKATAWIEPVLEDLWRKWDKKDEALASRFITWAESFLDHRHGHTTTETNSLGELPRLTVNILEQLDHDLVQKHLQNSSNMWLRQRFFEEEVVSPCAPEPTTYATLNVTPFLKPSFKVKGQVNGLAVSPDGRLLCAVGDNVGDLFDAESGQFLFSLDKRGWGYACHFDPKGERVAACYNGGFVHIFNTKTGTCELTLEGHEGWRIGVRKVRFSPDGKSLVSADDAGVLIVWDLIKGTERWRHKIKAKAGFSAIEFLEDGTFLASYDNNNKRPTKKIVWADLHDGVLREIKPKDVTWAIARSQSNMFAFGGGDSLRVGHFKGVKWIMDHEIALDRVTDLAWEGDMLWAVNMGGSLISVDFGDGDPVVKHWIEKGPQFWALAKHEDAIYASGKGNTMHVVKQGQLLERPTQHNQQICGTTSTKEGEVISFDWVGRVIRWDSSLTQGQELVSLQGRGESAAVVGNAVVFAHGRGLSRVSLETCEVEAENDALQKNANLAVWEDRMMVIEGNTLIPVSPVDLSVLGEPVDLHRSKLNALATTREGEFLWGTEHGEVGLVDDGQCIWRRRDHGSDMHEKGNPHCNVCSISAAKSASRFASGATDSVVRVYSLPDGEPEAVIHCGFGLFNRLSLDAEGRFLAIPNDRTLAIYDLEHRRLHAMAHSEAFDGNAILTAFFLDDGRVVVGTKSGAMYQVDWEA